MSRIWYFVFLCLVVWFCVGNRLKLYDLWNSSGVYRHGNQMSPHNEFNRGSAQFMHGERNESHLKDNQSKNDFLTECSIKNIRRVDIQVEPSKHQDCIKLNVTSVVRVCVFPFTEDKVISNAIHKKGIWEPVMTHKFQTLLKRHPQITVIDIGANVGYYSLIAASLGHTVIAVEPNPDTVELLKASVVINDFKSKITILQNAITDFCGSAAIMTHRSNFGDTRVFQGNRSINTRHFKRGPEVISITMDALTDVVKPGSELMIKMDIQGHEANLLKHAEKFFATNTIAFIFMEWNMILDNYKRLEYKKTTKKTLVQLVLDRMNGDYIPLSVAGEPLKSEDWLKWPADVLWVLSTYM